MSNVVPIDVLFPHLAGNPAVLNPRTPDGRDALLARAVADGRLIERSIPVWRKKLERDPDNEAAELASLASMGPGREDISRLFPWLREA
jgi:hypothetical protein